MTGPSITNADAARVLVDAIAARVFPAAAVDVGTSAGPIWTQALGALTFDAGATQASIETPFDLASLTKAIATTTIAMDLVARGILRRDRPIAECFPEWRGADREGVTVADLLEHASGLPARLVDAPPAGRREFEHDICTMPLEYTPRTTSIYSDLGFILLGFLLSDLGRASLANQLETLQIRLKPDTTGPRPRSAGDVGVQADRSTSGHSRDVRAQAHLLTFGLPPDLRRLAAPTMPMADDARRGRMLRGDVHDNYAAALSGAAGHAGLFGTAPAVGAFARVVLRALRGDATLPAPWTPELVRRFAARTAVPGSSRALGWDTMLRSSSCGTRMSASAVGHVGFTGTSLWVDPERDRYFVLLTNRACGAGTLDQMRAVRRAFHDALNLVM